MPFCSSEKCVSFFVKSWTYCGYCNEVAEKTKQEHLSYDNKTKTCFPLGNVCYVFLCGPKAEDSFCTWMWPQTIDTEPSFTVRMTWYVLLFKCLWVYLPSGLNPCIQKNWKQNLLGNCLDKMQEIPFILLNPAAIRLLKGPWWNSVWQPRSLQSSSLCVCQLREHIMTTPPCSGNRNSAIWYNSGNLKLLMGGKQRE